MPKKRCRQHVNPLSFRAEVERPDWEKVFPDLSRPLEVDVGCGKGTFLLARAASVPGRNLVGLEIRKPMVERARKDAAKLSLTNVFVLEANANLHFASLFREASVERVYVHFPDPWFKKRHHKLRVVTKAFLEDLASRLRDGGELHFMTDYEEYAKAVLPLVEAHAAFENALGPGTMALAPLVPDALSDREEWHMRQGDPIFRYLFRRRGR
ncbi:tRNA (guanosine(46)-N7)-methyltransferase TrmB [bacterium]|nr:tRNA (guanosine(46)-N7)-methyltransferase TrmB [bacterium]